MESTWNTPCGFHDRSIPFHIFHGQNLHFITVYTLFHMESMESIHSIWTPYGNHRGVVSTVSKNQRKKTTAPTTGDIIVDEDTVDILIMHIIVMHKGLFSNSSSSKFLATSCMSNSGKNISSPAPGLRELAYKLHLLVR